MSWKRHKLGELISVKHGWAFKSQHFEDEGRYVVLTPGNFFEEGGFKHRPGKDRSYSGSFASEYLLSEGDLIVAMTEQGPGLLGSAAIIPDSGRFLHNQRIGLVSVKDESRACLKYLYYLFNTAAVRGQLSGSATGTKVRHTAPERICRVEALVPDFPTQKRIAGILSAYDDLIENNRRRIRLLEQAARLLYREWFVHLRFPGHETTKITDGLPEGWEKTTVGEHCPLIYGKALKAETRVDGPFDVYGSSGIVGTHNKALTTGPAIIVGRKGNVGSIYWARRGSWPIDTVYFVDPANSDFFTFFALQNIAFQNTDVAVPGLNRDYAHTREIKLPPKELIHSFNDLATVFLRDAELLASQNDALTRARDLLLPRLMDGRIPV